MTDLRCPACNDLLKRIDEVPEPRLVDGDYRYDITCPDCDTALSVVLEITLTGDGLIRKYVERRDD